MNRRAASWTLLFGAVYLSIELLSWSGLRLLEKWKGIAYEPVNFALEPRQRRAVEELAENRYAGATLSATLGWEGRRDSQVVSFDESTGTTRKTTVNSQGIRGSRDYARVPGGGVTRVAAFGDSFTFGAAVSDEDCWTAQLETLDDRLELLNFGVGGHALDQALLRYREEGVGLAPKIVLIGFLSENIKRHVNVFRPFLYRAALPVSKPRFVLRGDALELLPNPMPSPADYRALLADEGAALEKLGEHDYFYQRGYRETTFDVLPSVRIASVLRGVFSERFLGSAIIEDGVYNERSEAFGVTLRLMEEFYREVRDNGATPIVLVFPNKDDVRRYRRNGTRLYAPLLSRLERLELLHVDLMDPFEKVGASYRLRELFNPPPELHYSPLGNEIVSRWLFDRFLEWGLLTAPQRTAASLPESP